MANAIPELTLTIVEGGLTVTKVPEPFYVGQPKSTIQITVVNEDVQPHRLTLEHFAEGKNGHPGKAHDPLTGDKTWMVLQAPSAPVSKTFKVKPDSYYGSGTGAVPYTYDVLVDNTSVIDPEIVVDPPPPFTTNGGKKKKGGSKKKNAAKKAAPRKKAARKAKAAGKQSGTKKRSGKKRAGKKRAGKKR
jgi:hypothetical protein